MPVIYPGQEEPFARPAEKDLDGALEAEADGEEEQAAVTVETEDDIPTVEAVECETGVDCQLNRALELLADTTGYRQALAQAAVTHAQ